MLDNGGCLATNNVGSKGERATREGSRSAIFVNSAAFVKCVVVSAKSRPDPTGFVNVVECWFVNVVGCIGTGAGEEVVGGREVGVG